MVMPGKRSLKASNSGRRSSLFAAYIMMVVSSLSCAAWYKERSSSSTSELKPRSDRSRSAAATQSPVAPEEPEPPPSEVPPPSPPPVPPPPQAAAASSEVLARRTRRLLRLRVDLVIVDSNHVGSIANIHSPLAIPSSYCSCYNISLISPTNVHRYARDNVRGSPITKEVRCQILRSDKPWLQSQQVSNPLRSMLLR